MKKIIFLLMIVAFSGVVKAQDIIRFHQNGSTSAFNLYENDSIYFNTDHSNLYFSNNGTVTSYLAADIDSITFIQDETNSIFIDYNGDAVTITNPLSSLGVSVTASGAHVTVNSTLTVGHVNFVLRGNTTNGSFKIYSATPFNVLMNNVSILNPSGPALNSQSERQMDLILVEGTINALTDGTTYAAAPIVGGVAEDQKAALFSEGDVDVLGGGTLNIDGNGSAQHAFACDKDVEIKQGALSILGSILDGIHASDRLNVKGGSVSIVSSDDGASAGGTFSMECGLLNIITSTADTKGITSDTLVVVSGGNITIAHSGAQSKGISSSGDVRISGGTVQVTNSGASVLTALGSGMDVSHSAGITSDGHIQVSGGNITVLSTGLGGRAFKSDLDYVQTGGTVTTTVSGNGATYTNSTGTLDAYHSTCVKTVGDLIVNGGELTATASGSGGKGFESDGDITVGDGASNPLIEVTTTGTNITITAGGGGGPGGGSSGNYDEAKAIKSDMVFTLNSGTLNIDSNDDGVKALQGVTVNGGTLNIIDSKEGVESQYITINGGTCHVKSSDDSFNATAGTGGESNDGSLLLIHGGYVHLDASGGDPLDSNGNVTVNGGFVVVHGPQSSPEVGMDYNGTGKVDGGVVIISGTNSNMTQGFGTSSTQRSLILKTTSSLPANTIIHLEDSNGNEVFSFKPVRAYYSIVYSGPALVNGATYRLYSSGTHTGTVQDGFITGGAYTSGTLETTFTISTMVSTVNF